MKRPERRNANLTDLRMLTKRKLQAKRRFRGRRCLSDCRLDQLQTAVLLKVNEWDAVRARCKQIIHTVPPPD